MNQGHPHAELMLQYAQDAMTTAKPWKLWEYCSQSNGWISFISGSPNWLEHIAYRRKPISKPIPRLIHGVEVPDISFTPNEGETYITPSISHVELYNHFGYNGDLIDRHNLKHNLCYPITEEGKQAAILHAKAMLGVADA